MPLSAPATHGRTVRSAEVGEFHLTEAAYAPGQWVAPHDHTAPAIVFLLSGGYRERLGREEIDIAPRQLFVRRGAVRHCNFFGREGARCLILEYRGTLRELPPALFGRSGDWQLTHHDALTVLGHRIAGERWGPDAASRMVVEGLALELLGELARSAAPKGSGLPGWLPKVRDRLLAEFVDPPPMPVLALEAGVHPSHLVRAFRRHYGIRPGLLVQRARIEWACAALAERDRPLAIIARDAGFADQSHFGRIFKRVTGTTPAAFRERLAG